MINFKVEKLIFFFFFFFEREGGGGIMDILKYVLQLLPLIQTNIFSNEKFSHVNSIEK